MPAITRSQNFKCFTSTENGHGHDVVYQVKSGQM